MCIDARTYQTLLYANHTINWKTVYIRSHRFGNDGYNELFFFIAVI